MAGGFPEPKDAENEDVVYVDSQARRAYMFFVRVTSVYLAEYDIDRVPPRLVRDKKIGPLSLSPKTSPYTWTLDTKRHRLLSIDGIGADIHSIVRVIDQRSLDVAAEWSFADPSRLPGFYAYGITYSARDDRIYLLGSMVQSDYAQALIAGETPAEPPIVVALDAESGSVVWVRPVPECQQAVYEDFKGSAILRSQLQDVLYFACTSNRPAGGFGLSGYPGHSGIIRLEVDPKGSAVDALASRADFFAISGSFPSGDYGGAVAFDPGSDRMFLQSISPQTPGAWVFDGRLQSWAGFVAAPDVGIGAPQFWGVNPRTGQYYIGGGSDQGIGYMLVTNDRALPIPQGVVYKGLPSDWFILVDEKSGRLFVNTDRGPDRKWTVLDDRTPEFLPAEGADFDSLTNDIDEGPDTEVSYVSGISGYGAKATLVGGYAGAVSSALDPDTFSSDLISRGLVRPSARALTLGSVSSVDLRTGSSSATAQAGSPDPDTASEVGTTRNTVESQSISRLVAAQLRQAFSPNANLAPALQEELEAAADVLDEEVAPQETTAPIPEARATVAGNLQWPWGNLACLDGGGEKAETDAPENLGGSASIKCDLASNVALAKARWGHFVEGPLTIASASFDSTGWRDPKTGANTLITATADGIELVLEGVGTLKIGHIESTVKTVAHGRPGTAKASWSSVIEQVRAFDASGNALPVPQGCDDHASCKQLAEDLTHDFAGRIRFSVPDAHVEQTDKGAFATVEKEFKDHLNDSTVNDDDSRAVPALQIEIYKDGVERSRLVLQFAAIQANSIYTIAPGFGSLPPEGPPIVPGTTIPGTPIFGGGDGGFNGPPGGGGGVQYLPGVAGVFAFLVRTPLEALHAAGVWILFGAAIFAVVRRRMFLMQLFGGGK